ncbi:hypothetical protein N6H18_16190 [Reichenbachiella agarivorans]|uniref:Uncharacterized protein n=1 Tax=Reichenbachiella agarivorans TaxID=2979464 RepID=A0ABY6CN26_9BACT|nr:hypothetical protein [Reichenbachiella agarivorans]UXP31887.1 hypothetical protein N6H18_16190 [Reichenbachiella agarivorans]
MGVNPPHEHVNDGDFNAVRAYWRQAKQSPFWDTRVVDGDQPMGIHYGTLFSSNAIGVAESSLLDNNPSYQQMNVGDVWHWEFGADLEYVCKGTISLSLVFGDQERILAEKVKLIGSDKTTEHFSGTYRLSAVDVAAGFPFVRATFYSEQDVKVYLDYVNIEVVAEDYAGPVSLSVEDDPDGMSLSWTDPLAESQTNFLIYRSEADTDEYQRVGETDQRQWLDEDFVTGKTYDYLVTRQMGEEESGPSPIASRRKVDERPPSAPQGLRAQAFDTEIQLRWDWGDEPDIAHYEVWRKAETDWELIAHRIKKGEYEDIKAPKGIAITYQVYAYDFSGNRSLASQEITTKVKTVWGASFIDLIQDMPIHQALSRELWGTDQVLPRDPDNGIEHPDWSYWGGHPVLDQDGKYHMLVVRWPEAGLKGHWEWPNSTVVHTIADQATGPYRPTGPRAYDYKDALGHNADIVQLNDGSFLLYSLIDWEPTLFSSSAMSGPWQREGVMKINYDTARWQDSRSYQVERNLSGVQLDDGSLLFVTKFGRMMKSTVGILGPYEVLTDVIQKNESIPVRYRHSNYEDPVMWKDEVQFHLLINAFLDKRAIYLRSPDGIHWTFDPGLAYDTEVTQYVDGTRTHWYKLERPHVIQDQYGRATHLSLAALDVPKAEDLSNDTHNSKNLIIPLQVHRRLMLLDDERVFSSASKIKMLIYAEPGFDPVSDLDISSLRFGSSSAVNHGRGAAILKTKESKEGLVLVFEGKSHELTTQDFVGKLIGKTKQGALVEGFVRLIVE